MRFLILALILVTVPARAQPVEGSDLMRGMQKMDHEMMTAPMNGNVDHDFVSMMVPHHRGAVEMSQTYLKTGRDPEIRKLAQEIIDGQVKEIRFMRGWQARHMPH